MAAGAAWHPSRGVSVSKSDRQRSLLGVPLGLQVLAVLVAVLALTSLVGLAVFSWLERTA